MPRAFNSTEKEDIRTKLIEECKKSWSVFGYKKPMLPSYQQK